MQRSLISIVGLEVGRIIGDDDDAVSDQDRPAVGR